MNKKHAINRAWQDALRLCDTYPGAARRLDNAYALCLKGEKKHRAFGQSVGAAGYLVPAHTAAKLLVLQRFFAGPDRAPQSWDSACTIRHDIAQAWAAAELVARSARVSLGHVHAEVLSLDLRAAIAGLE